MIQVIGEKRGDWYVVSVAGRADGLAAGDLEAALTQAVGQHSRVAANFAALDYISSAGLRAVLQAARAAQLAGGVFAVCSLTTHVRKVFDISGLHHVLTIHQELPC